MKTLKTLSFLLLALIWASTNVSYGQLQTTTTQVQQIQTTPLPQAECNCKGPGWVKDKPIVIQASTSVTAAANIPAATLFCGGNATLGNVGIYLISLPDYVCNLATCATTYIWQIVGPVNGSGNGKPFSFNFSLPGTYAVTVVPICGREKCEPCKFTITIRQNCNCNGQGWIKDKPVLIQLPSGQQAGTVPCGGTIGLGSTGMYTIYVPDFICNPSANCPATYTWQVMGPVNGYGSGKPFAFNFSVAGTYTVVVTPSCGGERCEPCKFIINIKSGCNCDGQGWIKDKPVVIQLPTGQPAGTVPCGGNIGLGTTGSYIITAPDFLCNPPENCPATYVWQVSGPVNGYGTGKPFSFNFSASGTYTVVITPVCGGTRCEPCKFIINIKPGCNCDGQGWITDKPVVIQSTAGTAGTSIPCGGTGQLNSTGTYTIISPDFLCNPPANCPATYQWQISGPVNGYGTGKPFTFNFSVPGSYAVVITPICGGVKCAICKFQIIVKPSCDCNGQGWTGPIWIAYGSGQPFLKVQCGESTRLASPGTYTITSPDFMCNPPAACPTTYVWQISGPANGSGTGKTFSFNFTPQGTYTLIITPVCGGIKCTPCKVTILVEFVK